MRAPRVLLTPLAMPVFLMRGRDPYQWAGCAARHLRLIYCTNVDLRAKAKYVVHTAS